MNPFQQRLAQLEALDFAGKAEAFVESKFLTPLLECLGYESHKDYEVVRHGDDGSSFKLSYPPVESGAKRVKHYSPDYVPTIRKKMFWIIEAKSPKDVTHPFDTKFLVQGLQYCIHPEIQAQYLLVSNGLVSSLFDAHGAVFLEKEIYEPVLEFRASELSKRWSEIYALLSVEKLRARIENDLKATYDKLCLSSLDKDYPTALLRQIGASSRENAQLIAKRVNQMYVESMRKDKEAWQQTMEALDAAEIFALMDDPMPTGTTEAHYFVKKAIAAGESPGEILHRLVRDFDRQSIFRKEQTFLAVCLLYLHKDCAEIRLEAKAFLDKYKDAELPLLNQVECALLRANRKSNVLHEYPKVREQLARTMQAAPELVRFVHRPSALSMSYGSEVELHHRTFEALKLLSDVELQRLLGMLLPAEAAIDEEFWAARRKLSDSETQILGFEIYGDGGRHYFFKGVLHNYGIELRPELTPKVPSTSATPNS
jgi:hypothetical protein